MKNYTINGKPCAYWNDPNPVHPPHPGLIKWADDNNIQHNTCTNVDQEFDGPWCYTTDPDYRWGWCGICDAKGDLKYTQANF